MENLRADLLARIERLEARLMTLEATPSVAVDAPTKPTPTERIAAEPSSRRDLLRYGAAAFGAATAGMADTRLETADGDPLLIGTRNTGTTSASVTTLLGNFTVVSS
jgi:hypothetical protein